MKTFTVIKRLLRAVAFTAMALILLLLIVVGLLYTPWVQHRLMNYAMEKLDGTGGKPKLVIGDFALRFPLTVSLENTTLIQQGDTMVSLGALDADVAPLSLIHGVATLNEASVRTVHYRIGHPDSSTFINMGAEQMLLGSARVRLSDLDIELEHGKIDGGRFSIAIRPDTMPPKPKGKPLKMHVNVHELDLHNFVYSMSLVPSIDTLRAVIGTGHACNIEVDLLKQTVKVGNMRGHSLDARYIGTNATQQASYAALVAAANAIPSSPSEPWTVTIDSLQFNKSHALYTTAGVRPTSGFDPGYIELSDLDLKVKNLYNQSSTVKLPMSARATERSGIALNLSGNFALDSTAMRLNELTVNTFNGTSLSAEAMMGMTGFGPDIATPVALSVDGVLAPQDIALALPFASQYTKLIPRAANIALDMQASGTTQRLNIPEFNASVNGMVHLAANGYVANMMQPQAMDAALKIKGNIINVKSIKNALLDPATAKEFNIPPMTLAGQLSYRRGTADADIVAHTHKGSIALVGDFTASASRYSASLDARDFPIQAFVPTMGLGALTGKIHAEGQGFDFFNPKTHASIDGNIASLRYNNVDYRNIELKASLLNGDAKLWANSNNAAADFSVSAEGNLLGDTYAWSSNINGRRIDLKALGYSKEDLAVVLSAKANASYIPRTKELEADAHIGNLLLQKPTGTVAITDVHLFLGATRNGTNAILLNRDMKMAFESDAVLDSLTTRLANTASILDRQMAAYSLNIDSLAMAMPAFTFTVDGGPSNIINDFLKPDKMNIRGFHLKAECDSVFSMGGYLQRFTTPTMQVDSMYMGCYQYGSDLIYGIGMINQPGNLDEWHKVLVSGKIGSNSASIALSQQNTQGKTGFKLGAEAYATRADSTIHLSLKPYLPTIGYQQWNINDDNFISYQVGTGHIDANLKMEGGNSTLALYTQHDAEHEAHHNEQEDLIIKLGNIHLSDWIAFNPFAPPIKGDINADMRLNRHGDLFVGQGTAGISEFTYGKDRVADFRADFDVAASGAGSIMAKADLFVDNQRTMTVSGALNDSTANSAMNLDFAVINFPLATVNPFLPPNTAKLSGALNGSMKITGSQNQPVYNGSVSFNDAAVGLAITGTKYAFSNREIPVTNGVVEFDRFTISGVNQNPLYVGGTVDISELSNAKINLGMHADNMMLVNTSRAARGADVFGKAYISLDATAKGSMKFLNVNANLSLLAGTNVTYVMPSGTQDLTSRSNSDMVKFVNFTDSVAVANADTIQNNNMAMLLDATLSIQSGSIVNVYLSPSGADRMQLQAEGTLQYALSPLDNGRLSGRLNIDKGFVRYTPPLLSEKYFTFQNGSYVSFMGDMMNPTLNIHATDVMKANVTQEGQNSRLVNFDVLLGVTGTLNTMNVVFDLSTNDDIAVANELESMSAEQRANQAMNLLLYNVYTGPGTHANAALSGNPLFSFLQSQVNSWAANNIRGVDLSFGINQYDRTSNGTTSSTMSYSYQVSKSLFNDRFKIVVGGNYSTDANADENFSQNLINDISFEYFLNQQRNMYLRLFRHTGYESILEGEITQTGVGFVYRRKLRRVGDIFLTPAQIRRRDQKAAEREAQAQSTQNSTAK